METDKEETSDILENLERRQKIKKLLIVSIISVLLVIIIFIGFSAYFYFKSPEKTLGLGANIEQALLSQDGKISYVKLLGGSLDKNITKIKFVFTDEQGKEYVYETSEGIKEIEVPFKRSFWDWLLGRQLKGVYDYEINSEEIGIENFNNINEVGVVFEYETGTGEIIETPVLDTTKPITTSQGGGGGNGHDGGCNPSCSGKVCGDDGCGGNCLPGCQTGENCQGGKCIPISCTNKIQDGDEEGVDCGKSCEFECPTNYKSGISVLFNGTPGEDYAEEYLYYDKVMDDHKVVYIKSNANITMQHNERNVISGDKTCSGGSRVIGINGEDGIPDSGDEGKILFKVDRDRKYYNYGNFDGVFINYSKQFSFSDLKYDLTTPVVGTIGISSENYSMGINDSFGDEWHILTYWDNDKNYSCLDGRASLSDAKIVSFVVNPKTPLISFKNTTSLGQYYTTPAKTYWIPLIFNQTTYLTDNVEIKLTNIMTSDAIYYKINNGASQSYSSAINSNILNNGTNTIEYWYGSNVHKIRKIVKNPDYPSNNDTYPDGSKHGYLLWKDDAELNYIKQKLTRQPFSTSFYYWKDWSLSTNTSRYPLSVRPIWRGWPGVASTALNHIAYFSLKNSNDSYALIAKKALLDLFVVDPVGGEQGGYETTNPAGSPDRLDIPNSGVLPYVNSGIAYDLLIGNYKKSNYTNGVTPIEDYKIRDNLASQADIMMLSRINTYCGRDYLYCWGSMDMHYALGYEEIATSIGIAMPSYNTEYYGTSGFDFMTNAKYKWTPYPNQSLTWKEILTNASIEEMDRPNVYSKARYFTAFKNFSQLTDNYSAYTDLPLGKVFWVAANSFLCCKGMYAHGTSASSMNTYGCIKENYDFNCSAVGLFKINTISGTMCQKSGGYSWYRSFNMPGDCISNGDKMYHVEYAGYETPFIGPLMVLNNIYKKKYGIPLTQSVEDYINVKIDRIAGNFDSNYLQQYGTGAEACFDHANNENEFTFNNSEQLVCTIDLSLYNPINTKTKDIVHYPKEFMSKYGYFQPKKLEPSIFAMIFYEDNESRYGEAPAVLKTNNISQFNITWFFNKEYEYGTFANGDYWVVGPVTVIDIDPRSYKDENGSVRHGSMINPDSSKRDVQGFDNRLCAWNKSYNFGMPNGNNISESNPLIIAPNSSLVSARSRYELGSWATKKMQLLDVAVLTILDNPPPEGSFRPPYAGSNKSVKFKIEDLNYSKLGNYNLIGNAPTLESLKIKFERVWLDYLSGACGSYSHPENNMPSDGGWLSEKVADAAIILNSNYTNEDKEKLLISMIQLGIDNFGVVETGNIWAWRCDGQIGPGRKFPILFAGIMLNNSKMKNIGEKSGDYLYQAGGAGNEPIDYIHFAEDDQTFYVKESDIFDPPLLNWLGSVYAQTSTGDSQIVVSNDINGSPRIVTRSDGNNWSGFGIPTGSYQNIVIKVSPGNGNNISDWVPGVDVNYEITNPPTSSTNTINITTNFTGQLNINYDYKIGYTKFFYGHGEYWDYMEYTEKNLGMPAWGIRHSRLPASDGLDWNRPYDYQTDWWSGFVLAAHMMDMKELWNHDALFDYLDSRKSIKSLGWIDGMWDAYRANFGCVWTRNNQSDLYSQGHYNCFNCLYNCLQSPYCGDESCNGAENSENCPYDCGGIHSLSPFTRLWDFLKTLLTGKTGNAILTGKITGNAAGDGSEKLEYEKTLIMLAIAVLIILIVVIKTRNIKKRKRRK